MRKKRTSLLLATLLLFSIFISGCGMNEIGYLSYLEEVQKVAMTKPTQTVSTVSFSNINLPEEFISTEEEKVVQAVTTFLDSHYITMTSKVHPTKNIASVSVDIKEKVKNTNENILTINYKDDAMAILMGEKLKELLKVAPEDIQLTLNQLDQKSLPLAELDPSANMQNLLLNPFSNRKALVDMNDKAMAFLKDFAKIYVTADTELIKKEGNAYVFQMDTPELVQFIDVFVTKSIENKDALLQATIRFYDSLTDEEFNMLYGGIFPFGKAEIIASLNEAIETPIPEGTLETWNATYASEIAPMISSAMDGTSLRMKSWKENNNYYTNTYVVLNITNPMNPASKFTGTILSREETQVISDSFDIVMPTEVVPESVMKGLFPTIPSIDSSIENIELEP